MKIRLFVVFSIFSFVELYAQGLLFTPENQKSHVEQYIEEDRGFTSYLPSSYSLEKFAPPIRKQSGSSCVGWATCYAAASILHNIDRNVTSSFEKEAFAFDPYYMYSIMHNNSEADCVEGLNFVEAMSFFEDYGTKRWAMPPFLSCDSKWSEDRLKDIQYQSQPFTIDNYYKLEVSDIELLKKIIYDRTPIIIGASVDESFGALFSSEGTVGSTGLWNPDYTNDSDISGHAMTIVGYDDYKFGGAFQIMNSWGTGFGDNGYVWIKYKDFTNVVSEAWKISKKSFKNVETDYYNQVNFKDGNTYEGNLNDEGEMHMLGYFHWKESRDIYFGYWYNGNRDGQGLYFDYSEKEIFYCEYDEDVLMEIESLGFSDDGEKSDIELYLEKFNFDFKFSNANESTNILDVE